MDGFESEPQPEPSPQGEPHHHDDSATTRRLDTSRLAPFDKDIRDDCRNLQLHCTSEIFAHVYLQCPASCTKLLEEQGMKGTASSGTEDVLYEVGNLRTRQGKRVDADRFEGSVLVLAVVPLLPGMAVYFYELMEHLHTIYGKQGAEFVVLPIDHELGIHIQERSSEGKKQGVVVLEEEPGSMIENHPWMKHLMSIRPRSGAASRDHDNDDEVVHQTPLHTDRVTFYIVSADGYFVERVISPTMAVLRQKISTYLKTVDYEL
jgi:hypothetical protein